MMANYSVHCFVEVDDNGRVFYVCRHPELPGCMAQSLKSIEEARQSLDEAREMYLEHYPAPLPEPFVIRGSGTYDLFRPETFTR